MLPPKAALIISLCVAWLVAVAFVAVRYSVQFSSEDLEVAAHIFVAVSHMFTGNCSEQLNHCVTEKYEATDDDAGKSGLASTATGT